MLLRVPKISYHPMTGCNTMQCNIPHCNTTHHPITHCTSQHCLAKHCPTKQYSTKINVYKNDCFITLTNTCSTPPPSMILLYPPVCK